MSEKQQCDRCGKQTKLRVFVDPDDVDDPGRPVCRACQQHPTWTDSAPKWDEAKVEQAILANDHEKVMGYLRGALKRPIIKAIKIVWRRINASSLSSRLDDAYSAVMAHIYDDICERLAIAAGESSPANYLLGYYSLEVRSILRESVKDQQRGGMKWDGRSPNVKRHKDILAGERDRIVEKTGQREEFSDNHHAAFDRWHDQKDDYYMEAVGVLAAVAKDHIPDDLRTLADELLRWDGPSPSEAIKQEGERRAAIGGRWPKTPKWAEKNYVRPELAALCTVVTAIAPWWAVEAYSTADELEALGGRGRGRSHGWPEFDKPAGDDEHCRLLIQGNQYGYYFNDVAGIAAGSQPDQYRLIFQGRLAWLGSLEFGGCPIDPMWLPDSLPGLSGRHGWEGSLATFVSDFWELPLTQVIAQEQLAPN